MKTSHQYTVERHTHGWLIKGAAPHSWSIPMAALNECVALVKPAKRGVMHPGVASAMGATVAMGIDQDMERWAAEIEDHLATGGYPKHIQWLRGTKTGRSSITIFFALEPRLLLNEAADFNLTGGELKPRFGIPYDADDFARCRYLVDFMGWRERLHEVSAKHPEWAGLVAHWGALTTLQDRGELKELTQQIQELLPK